MIDHLYIKRLAVGAGFDLCGIAPCRHLAENEALFRAWLARGRQSSLGYLERNVDKRFDARRLVEGARTALGRCRSSACPSDSRRSISKEFF